MNLAFEPYDMSWTILKNHIAMAPMTRSRAQAEGGLPTPIMVEYYGQRASAGLIISEGIQPSAIGQGYTNTPGLHSQEQVEAWKPVTKAVHDKGGVIYAQLMHAGRIGYPSTNPEGLTPVGPSAVQAAGQIFTYEGMKDFVVPRELSEDEILDTIQDYANAARNAIAAGFDGVEIHGANGYLVQQFLSENANQRTDRWGGSPENRARFAYEVSKAVAEAIGADKTGIRFSPGGAYNDIQEGEELEALYLPLVKKLGELNLVYVHLMEQTDRALTTKIRETFPNTFILNPFTGGFGTATGPEALELIDDGTADIVSFGALFLANPDLPERLAAGGPYNTPDPATFFGGDEHGYTDYPAL